jgi:hypothetical protein
VLKYVGIHLGLYHEHSNSRKYVRHIESDFALSSLHHHYEVIMHSASYARKEV